MLIVSIDPKSIEKIEHKGKLGNRVGDENSGELAHTIRGGGNN
jgi:hypothetical protein